MAKVSAGRGWHWVGQAIRMAVRQPGIFPVMGLIVAVISLVPILGGLVITILGPALVAGSVLAARDCDLGRTPRIAQLFQLFAEQRAGAAMALCIPVILSQLVAGMIVAGAIMSRLSEAGVDLKTVEADPTRLVQFFDASMFGWVLLAVVVTLIGYAFTVLAIPRVGLDRAAAPAAMRESFAAVRSNWSAWLLAAVGLFLCMFVPMLVFYALTSAVIAQFVANAVIYTLLGPTLFAAYRDLRGNPAAAGEHEHPMPPPSFEA